MKAEQARAESGRAIVEFSRGKISAHRLTGILMSAGWSDDECKRLIESAKRALITTTGEA